MKIIETMISILCDILKNLDTKWIISIIIGVLGLPSLFFNKVRQSIYRIFHPSKVKLGIIKVYKTRDIAIKKNWEDINSSNFINILNFKGYSLIQKKNPKNSSPETNTRFIALLNNKNKANYKFLILNPLSVHYIQNRTNYLEITDDVQNKPIEEHQNDISDTINQIRKKIDTVRKYPTIECRFFSEELKWALIIIKDYLFVSPYSSKRQNETPCIKLKNDSILGCAFIRHFDDLWNNKSVDALTHYNKFCIVVLVGGSFMGKSIIAHHIAEKYDFSEVICTDVIRNQLLIETNNNILYSTSTPKMENRNLKKQKKDVSEILIKTIDIYSDRGEKIIIEGMHFTQDALTLLKNKENCLIIGIDNTLSLNERLMLKKKTTRPKCKCERDYSEQEKDKMKDIHNNLMQMVDDGNTIRFTDIEKAKQECDRKVEEFFSTL